MSGSEWNQSAEQAISVPLILSAAFSLFTLAAATSVSITQNEAVKEEIIEGDGGLHKAGIEGWPWLWTQRNPDGTTSL
jgi:hypothetical protein